MSIVSIISPSIFTTIVPIFVHSSTGASIVVNVLNSHSTLSILESCNGNQSTDISPKAKLSLSPFPFIISILSELIDFHSLNFSVIFSLTLYIL